MRKGSDYYVVTSSIETTPSLQILHSTDLVNYAVVGSVSRHWFSSTTFVDDDGRTYIFAFNWIREVAATHDVSPECSTASVPLGNSSDVQTERGSERPAAAAAG
jgi:beta-xylosidase